MAHVVHGKVTPIFDVEDHDTEKNKADRLVLSLEECYAGFLGVLRAFWGLCTVVARFSCLETAHVPSTR